MITALFLMLSVAFGQTCEELSLPRASGRVDFAGLKTVGMNGWIEAVQVSDLRAWVRPTARTRFACSADSGWSGLAADAGRRSDPTRSPSLT